MKTYLIHHTPKTAAQDTWAVSFSLPYIAGSYARAGDGIWYIKTWLTTQQIKRRLAILLDDQDELNVHEIGRDEPLLNRRLCWMQGRLEDEEPAEFLSGPRLVWSALQSAVHAIAAPALSSASATASSSKNSQAA